MSFGGLASSPTPKRVDEVARVSFDFLSSLAAGETISTQQVVASVYSGDDLSPSSIVSGSASLSGTTVYQNISAGVAGVVYQLACIVNTSTGRRLEQASYLSVVPILI